MPDDFRSTMEALDSPADNFFAVTPHDTNPTIKRTRGIYVGGTGNVSIRDEAGNAVVFNSVPVGTILPVRTEVIMATNTTATNLVGLY